MVESVPDLLGRDHHELSLLLDRLRLALIGQDLDSCFQLLDEFWARLAMHIRAEHLHLFPAIVRAAECRRDDRRPALEEVNAAIDALRADHNFFMQQLSESIKSFRAAMTQEKQPLPVCDSVRDRINAVADRLEEHNQLEEGQVYQWATLLLSKTELGSLNTSLRRELDNMPPRFQQV
jgi:hemerythrin superfamily protein